MWFRVEKDLNRHDYVIHYAGSWKLPEDVVGSTQKTTICLGRLEKVLDGSGRT